MIEFKNVSFAYGTLATPQSMTDSASEDSMGATEPFSAKDGTNPG